jgi:hypothetical protein
MPLTATETALVGVIAVLLGIGGGASWARFKGVTRGDCKNQHKAEEKLNGERHERIDKRLGSIEEKIDKLVERQ